MIMGCTSQLPVTGANQTVIGIVTQSSGFPEVIRNNQNYILGVQSRIYSEDVLITDKRSKLLINMSDGATFKLGPMTHFALRRYDEDVTFAADLTMSSGSIQVANHANRRLEIKTPIAELLTSGGEFWFGFGFSENTLDIALLEGSGVTVSNQHGSTDLNETMWGTSVIGDSAPQPARTWSSQKKLEALEQTEL